MRNSLLLAVLCGALTLKFILKVVQSIVTFAFSHLLQIVQEIVVRYISTLRHRESFHLEFLAVSPSFAVFCVHLLDSQPLDVQFTFFV